MGCQHYGWMLMLLCHCTSSAHPHSVQNCKVTKKIPYKNTYKNCKVTKKIPYKNLIKTDERSSLLGICRDFATLSCPNGSSYSIQALRPETGQPHASSPVPLVLLHLTVYLGHGSDVG